MKFSIGINYWPAERAMYWWSHFNAQEVERDLARIRDAGFDAVRIFLLWEDFQPAPDQVSSKALEQLVRVADAAAVNQLSLVPTLFTGHMSGVNWIPEWALEARAAPSRFRVVTRGEVVHSGIKNWYVDEKVMGAQALLARAAALALRNHPALWAWDLGNENSNCVIPPTRAAGCAWLERMAGEIKSVDPVRPITIGLHAEDLEEDRRLGPQEAARVCDFLCMHGYPMYATWAGGPTDARVLPFLGLLTQWLGQRAVLFEEFGAPTAPENSQTPAQSPGAIPLLDAEAAALFTRRALPALHRFGFLGAMLWCYSDYAQTLWNKPPLDAAVHERYFGLWLAEPKESPAAKPALAEIKTLAGVDRRLVPDDYSWIDVRRDDYYSHPRENLERLYRKFCALYPETGG